MTAFDTELPRSVQPGASVISDNEVSDDLTGPGRLPPRPEPGTTSGVATHPIEYDIAGFGYRAAITEVGASLRDLTFDGRALVVGFDRDPGMVAFRGALCAPWPNRVADGRYRVDGQAHQLPVNEPSRNCSLHGLVFDRDWQLVCHDAGAVTLAMALDGAAGYPFRLSLQVRYEITESGLTTQVTARNVGEGVAPYGVCPHPYLRAGDSPLSDWSLTLPASNVLDVTPDRLLPIGRRAVADGPFDFQKARPLGQTEIDHAFTGIARDVAGSATVELREPSGQGVALTFGAELPWLQIHTADLPTPGRTRLGLAVEPMTCPPDAFNSGTDLVRLAPGDNHHAAWRIHALS